MEDQKKINEAIEILASAVREGSFPKENPSFVSMDNFPLICARITNLDRTMTNLAEIIDQKYVTKEAFSPVKQLVFGVVGLMLSSIIIGLLGLVLLR